MMTCVVSSSGGVPGERPWSVIEGVELNCGCPAGPADEKYYLCNEYVSGVSIAKPRVRLSTSVFHIRCPRANQI